MNADAYAGHAIRGWDGTEDLAGQRVAVITSAATAARIVPHVVRTAGTVKVFQRRPGWVLPQAVAPLNGLLGPVPVPSAVLERVARAHLNRQVRDGWLRRQLTPDGRASADNVLVSSAYYPALQQSNCKLITWPIATFCPQGLRTSDGIEHRFDVVVWS